MDGSFVSIAEQQTYLRFLKFGQREDKRAAFDFRDWKVIYGKHTGTCVVYLGNTTLICSANVLPKRTTRSNQVRGLSKIDVEISPVSFSKFQWGRKKLRILRKQLRQHIKSSIFWSKCVDDESLCIARGKAVFLVSISIEIVHADGNLFDASCLAAVACLLNTKRPEILVDGDKIEALSTFDRTPIPLQINHIPVSTTFGFQNSSHFLIVDPSAREEIVLNGSLTVVVNQNGEICGTYKRGSAVLPVETLNRCAEIAAMRATEVAAKLRELAEADAKQRERKENLDFIANLRRQRDSAPELTSSLAAQAMQLDLAKMLTVDEKPIIIHQRGDVQIRPEEEDADEMLVCDNYDEDDSEGEEDLQEEILLI